jgi:hypothetical protein
MSFISPAGTASNAASGALDQSNPLNLPLPEEVGPTKAAATGLSAHQGLAAQSAPAAKSQCDQLVRSEPASPNVYNSARKLGLTWCRNCGRGGVAVLI